MPFPDDPCEHCPRAARGLPMPCRAMTLGHARYCERVAAGEAAVIARLCGDAPKAEGFPPLAEQARNLAGAVGRFIGSGGKLATAEERDRRLAICGGCDRFEDGRCRECGCRLAWKVSMASEHCPLPEPMW
jgi:hypothetical protein